LTGKSKRIVVSWYNQSSTKECTSLLVPGIFPNLSSSYFSSAEFQRPNPRPLWEFCLCKKSNESVARGDGCQLFISYRWSLGFHQFKVLAASCTCWVDFPVVHDAYHLSI
jgi:hypothetical protein